jgi:biotin transport system substrate-specific component
VLTAAGSAAQLPAAVHAGAVHDPADDRADRRRRARARALARSAQILYLTLGIIGLPVFAFSPELPQGVARLMGPTGGYLMAYPIAAFVTGLLAERGLDRRYFTSILAMSAGLSVIFAGGVLWIARLSGMETALATGLYPFVVVDVIKVVAAGLVLPTAWKFLRH